MKIIPVIDLMGGCVVRARGGERAHYAPLETPLAATSRPGDVVAGFLALHPFRTIYIADLDAITGRGDQAALVADLESNFPDVEFWVDRGVASERDAARWLAQARGRLVIGSESLDNLAAAPRFDGEPRRILSLDFRGEDFLGPAELVADNTWWPRQVIVMSLGKVGSGSGPDFDRLRSLRERAGSGHDLHAAGGVRDADDLRRLARFGIAGVLIASALHKGAISATDLRATEMEN